MLVHAENQKSNGDLQYYRCFTCSSCDIECPVNQRTGRLFPRLLVRFSVFGYRDELIRERSIWYCIECDRCSRACPMNVKPSRVIKKTREEAVKKGIVTHRLLDRLKKLRKHLQKIRSHVVNEVFSNNKIPDIEKLWESTLENRSDYDSRSDLKVEDRKASIYKFGLYLDSPTLLTSCWACGACTNACPVAISSSLFSPMKIIRQVNWGFHLEPLNNGRMWLCINCERCLDACPQSVKGAWIIKSIQSDALRDNPELRSKYIKWKEADRIVHRIYADSIDSLLSYEGL